MARATITGDFASAAETAKVLGVSRANTERLVRLAERTVSRRRNRKDKTKSNGAKKMAARKRR